MPKKRPINLDERMRQFCENYVAGMNRVEAMLAAGYSVSMARSGWGSAALKRPIIQEEIERLRAVQAKRLNITIDSLILELDRDRAECRALNRPEGAANITVKMATLLGFMKDKLPGDTIFINKPLAEPSKLIEMSVDEWVAEFSPKEIEHSSGNGSDE